MKAYLAKIAACKLDPEIIPNPLERFCKLLWIPEVDLVLIIDGKGLKSINLTKGQIKNLFKKEYTILTTIKVSFGDMDKSQKIIDVPDLDLPGEMKLLIDPINPEYVTMNNQV